MTPTAQNLLAFAHIGDLHLIRASERNFPDMLAIVAEIETECAENLDFVVLPGDNANYGVPEQERSGAHMIMPALAPYNPSPTIRSGSDAASIGAWPENGVYGTQLGPNRNGRKW